MDGWLVLRFEFSKDHFDRHRLAALTLLRADPPHILELLLDVSHATINLAAIGLKLRFTRTAGTNPTAELRHLRTATRQAGQQVLQLRKLNLQLALASP